MKLLSWNVNGIRAVSKNINFNDVILNKDYDIIAFQEVKASFDQIDDGLNDSRYQIYWNASTIKKGYSGTAIYTKLNPLKVINGIGDDRFDLEGRVLTLEFEHFFFVNCYVPNSQEELKRIDFRLDFESLLNSYLSKLKATKPVIVCGDLNVAHKEIDLKNPKANVNNPGFSPQERNAFNQLLESGFIDSYRFIYPATVKYSWWSYRFFAREKNIGWRIDYFLVSKGLESKIKSVDIYNNIEGSDHCPVYLEIDID
jgi:exodeoxyribonuclease-3